METVYGGGPTRRKAKAVVARLVAQLPAGRIPLPPIRSFRVNRRRWYVAWVVVL